MKNKSYWMDWVKKAGVRAVKTIAQAAIAGIGAAAAMGQIGRASCRERVFRAV